MRLRATPHPDDKYLFEFDYDEKGRMQFDTDGMSAKFTDRAKAAQEAKWKRLDGIFGPRKIIKSSMLASRGGKPPRLAYGWACTEEFYWDYAIHHNLSFDGSDDDWLEEHAGTSVIKYGELTEEQMQCKALINLLKRLASTLVLEDLSERVGVQLQWVRPFAPNELQSMLALYNNYDMGDRCLEMHQVGGVQHVANVVQEAMTFGDYKPELQWWYDWDHLRVDLSTPL